MVERLSAAMHFARTDVFWDLGLFMGQYIAYFHPLPITGVPTTPLLRSRSPQWNGRLQESNRQCERPKWGALLPGVFTPRRGQPPAGHYDLQL